MNELRVLLTVLFVGLKLTGHIAWSWLWVFFPLWLPYGIVIAIIGFGIIVYLICALCVFISMIIGEIRLNAELFLKGEHKNED